MRVRKSGVERIRAVFLGRACLRGWTVIEALFVISATVVMMGSLALVLGLLMRTSWRYQQAVVDAAVLHSLSDQLRTDCRQAVAVAVDEKSARFELAGGVAEYTIDPRGIHRRATTGSAKVGDLFRMPKRFEARFQKVERDGQESFELAVEVPKIQGVSPPKREYVIRSTIGADRRFAEEAMP